VGNDSVKGGVKREKEKKFPFLVSGSKQIREVGNEFSHSPTSYNQTRPL